jgi:hypothetical protein
MNMLSVRKKQGFRNWWIGVFLCIGITLVFCYSLIGNLAKPLGLTHNDVFQNMFIIKHIMDTVRMGDWGNLSTLPMFYGFENSYFFNEPFILHAIAGLPMYLVTGNIIITYNLLAVGTILASLIAVYAFAYSITGKYIPSVIAAVIAVLNPFIMGRFPDHLNLVTLVFLPLIFLFVERILKRPSPWNCFGLFLLLTGQLLTSFYYAAFLTFILPVYGIIRWRQVRTDFKKFFQWGTIAGALVFLFVVLSLVKVYSGTFLFSETAPELDRQQLLYFSAWPTDWLFTGKENVVYGAIRPLVEKNVPQLVHQGTPSEESLFPGVIAIVLWVLAFMGLRKTAYRQRFLIFAGIAGGCVVFSFGPVIHLTSSVTLPGVFDIVTTLDPVLRMTRVTARFAVFVFLFGGVIAAMVLDTLTTGKSRLRSTILPVIILFLILAEYWNYPFQFLTVSAARMDFYSKLNAEKHIRAILDVPVGDAMLSSGGNVRQEYMDSHYMLWATIAHNKTLIGGYEGFMPLEHYIRMHDVSTGFPSPETISKIRQWGTDAVILHEDEYVHPTDYHLAKVKLSAMGVPLLEEADGLALFDLTKIEVK